MTPIFARRYAPSPRNPLLLNGPCRALTLREWEVRVILCSLPLDIKQTLLAWLIAPTSRHWPRPDTFSPQRLPFTASDLREPAEPLPRLLWDEMKAVRQTLDMSLEALHGISRDLLLVAHGTRLRQLTGELGEPRALEEMETMTRPMPPGPRQLPEYLYKRWGGRWARYFLFPSQMFPSQNGSS